MRKLLLSLLAICVLSVSCSKELKYSPSCDEDVHSMPRYLEEVTEYLFPNSYYRDGVTTQYFARPLYDNQNRVVFAYCNFIGNEAFQSYEYGDNRIVMTENSKKGRTKTINYTLENDRIISALIVSDDPIYNGESFTYIYDSNNRLLNIMIKDPVSDDDVIKVEYFWDSADNIIKITTSFIPYSEETYEYKYEHINKYAQTICPFYISCIYYGGAVFLDEILMIEGYFGKSIPNDLPSQQIFLGKVTAEWKYTLDKTGFVTKISQSYNNKETREYTFSWK